MTVMGPTIANSFHTVLWNKMAWTVLKRNKVVLHRRYADDVLFGSMEYLSKFGAYLNTYHPKISFSFEREKNGKLSFLDVEAFWQKGKLLGLVVKALDSHSRGSKPLGGSKVDSAFHPFKVYKMNQEFLGT